jgi:hypothetical protein
MTISSEILDLWQQHSSAVFPGGYRESQIKGIDLPLLDAEIAGSILMYVSNDGTLDPARVKNLRERLIDVNTVVLLLDREELIYFDRLRRLATLVLQEVDK